MIITDLSPKQLRKAAKLQEKIEKLQKQLSTMLPFDPGSGIPAPFKAPKQKRKMSAASRKAIADAQKKRWAKFHAAKAKKK